jgi:hypothetical protein
MTDSNGLHRVPSTPLLALPFRVVPHDCRGKWVQIFHGSSLLGIAEALPEGFKVMGKRKVMPTIVLAAKQMIDSKINEARADEGKAQSMLNDLRRVAGPITANTERHAPSGAR